MGTRTGDGVERQIDLNINQTTLHVMKPGSEKSLGTLYDKALMKRVGIPENLTPRLVETIKSLKVMTDIEGVVVLGLPTRSSR